MNEIERADKAYEQSLDVPPSPYVWLMDSDLCCKCGCILDYFESVICTFCYEEQWKQEEQDFYDNWDSMAQEVEVPR